MTNNLGYRYPVWVGYKLDPSSDCFKAEALAPYVSGIDLTKPDAGGIWWCPSANTQTLRKMVAIAVAAAPAAFHPSYSYYARANEWGTGVATNPELMTESELRSDRLLMSDSWFYWWGNSAWFYNHGLKGSRMHFPQIDVPLETGIPKLAGLHQLYGDGRVSWIPGKSLDLSILPGKSARTGRVIGYDPEATYFALYER
jgi:hypothetical protein